MVQRDGADSRRRGGSCDDDVRERTGLNLCIARVPFGYGSCFARECTKGEGNGSTGLKAEDVRCDPFRQEERSLRHFNKKKGPRLEEEEEGDVILEMLKEGTM